MTREEGQESASHGRALEWGGQLRPRILVGSADPALSAELAQVLAAVGLPAPEVAHTPAAVLSRVALVSPDVLLLDTALLQAGEGSIVVAIRTLLAGGSALPVALLARREHPGIFELAEREGAQDVLFQPFHGEELRLRLKNLLNYPLRLRKEAELEDYYTLQMHSRTWDMLDVQERLTRTSAELTYDQTLLIEGLAVAAEYRVDATGQHPRRVGQVAARLADELGLPASQVELIRRAAPLHDLGTLAIPDEILLKPGVLTVEETARMQQHTTIGATLLVGARSPLLRLAQEIARTHQERWDGAGYPQRMAGEAIPLAARIVGLADLFDSLIHPRPYRPALSLQATLEEVERQRGRQIDPALGDVLLRLMERPARVAR